MRGVSLLKAYLQVARVAYRLQEGGATESYVRVKGEGAREGVGTGIERTEGRGERPLLVNKVLCSVK